MLILLFENMCGEISGNSMCFTSQPVLGKNDLKTNPNDSKKITSEKIETTK